MHDIVCRAFTFVVAISSIRWLGGGGGGGGIEGRGCGLRTPLIAVVC